MDRPHWEAMADDSMNKVLKTVIVLLYAYGFWCAVSELYVRFFG